MAGNSKVTKLTFHGDAFRAILRGQVGGVAADLTRRGARIAAAAGEGFGARKTVGGQRMRVTVNTETRAAARAEATDKTLTRSLGSGRG